jgi:hypothetical protein
MESDMFDSGKDLIFAAGAPGSKWSAMLRSITYNKIINISDESPENTYSVTLYSKDSGQEKKLAWHRGAYWGPYHKFGHKFDKLDTLSKDEILSEIYSAFSEEGGIKLIKSHWFSYHLDFIAETFPEAKIITVYLPDDVCFDWWTVVGGWDITYPIYTWYENDERMKRQIKEENAHITRFFARRGRSLDRYKNIFDLYNDLGLPLEFKNIDPKSLEEFVDENELTIHSHKFFDVTSKRISKTLLTVYNPNIHNNSDIFETLLIDDNYPKNNVRGYKQLENRNV